MITDLVMSGCRPSNDAATDSVPEESGFEPWSRYMADALETILVAWLAFAFLPERPTRSQGGTDGSNPLSSSGESIANLFEPK